MKLGKGVNELSNGYIFVKLELKGDRFNDIFKQSECLVYKAMIRLVISIVYRASKQR